MKFIHLADSHLASFFSYEESISNLIREKTWDSFENIFKLNRDVDFALIAGDLFERNYFTSADFSRLYKIFAEFSKDIYYVTGNHDYFDAYNTIFLNNKPNNLHIFTDDKLSMYEKGSVRIYGLSYKDRINNYVFPDEINLDDKYFNILIAHANVYPNPSNYLDLNPQLLENIGFSYVGLGHIHKPGHLNNSYYPGSIEPFDFSDIGDRGYILYDNGKILRVDSSLLRFYDFTINESEFSNENEIVNWITNKLDNKINFVRIKLNFDNKLDIDYIKENIPANYIEVSMIQNPIKENVFNLYPNSLLTKYRDKLLDTDDEIKKRALELGIDAILRTKR